MKSIVSLGLLPALFMTIALRAEMKPEDVLQSVSPHLVQIESLDGGGTGILVDDTGLVLTSLHVVASGLDLTITGKTEVGDGKEVMQQFEGGVLHKVHPTLDLALVKFDPREHKLKASKIPDQKVDLKNGAACYAIGHPEGGAGALTNSITDGVISTVRRFVGGDELIQFSAPVNPGNSGGALCNEEGKIIGVVTFKLEQREGIAFAIPFGGIDLDDFIDPGKRVGDQEMVTKLVSQAEQYYRAATGSVFSLRPPDEEYVAIAASLVQLALTEQPHNMRCFRMLAWNYHICGKKELAKTYYRRGFEIDPTDPVIAQRLGEIEAQAGNTEEAIELLGAAITHSKEGQSTASGATAKLAEIFSKQEEPDWSRVAYLLKWSEFLCSTGSSSFSSESKKLLEVAMEQADPDCVAFLFRHRNTFSLDHMRKVLSGGIEVPSEVRTARALFSDEAMKAWADEALGFSKALDDSTAGEDGESPLPDHFRKILPVLGGSAVIIVFDKLNKVALFDLQEGRITRFITPPTVGLKAAAGGTRLVLADPESITWHVYDLEHRSDGWKTYERKEGNWSLVDVTMSPYRSDLVWFVCKDKADFATTVLCALDEKEPFCPLPTTGNKDQIRTMFGQAPEFTVSASGLTLLGNRTKSHRAADVLRLDLQSASVFHSYKSVAVNGFRASSHPRLLVTNAGLLEFPDFKQFWRPPGSFGSTIGVFPIFGSESFMHVSRLSSRRRSDDPAVAQLRILHVPEPNPETEPIEIPLALLASDTPRDSVVRTFPCHVHATIGSRRVAIFDNSAKVVRIVTLPEIKGPPAVTSDVAVPGARFTRVLEMPEFKTASLVDAPDGMTFDATTKTLDWEVPKETSPNGIVEILILLDLPDGKQKYHVETVELRATE